MHPPRIAPDWSHPGAPLEPTWSRMVNIDQFTWLTRADTLEQLAQTRAELGIIHVRACGMFDDKVRTWGHDPMTFRLPAAERPRRINFQVVDYVIDRLDALRLRPVYTTCFTPSAMAAGALEIWQHTRTDPPRDLGEWRRFVRAGLEHELRHRGAETLESWYFECWNEPNLRGCFFGGDRQQFLDLWAATHEAVKAVSPRLRLGGPSTARAEWMEEFLQWTRARGCPPDYIIGHVYNNDSESAPLSPFDGPASHRVKDSPHFGAGVVRGTRRLLDSIGFRGEVHWNEWGRSWFPHDPLKETALEAAYVVKTMTEVSQTADIFAFWCLSDIYDQTGYAASEFQGNYGMLSLHGLRKPAYFAHLLLNRVVGRRVPVPGPAPAGLGALATVGPRRASVLLHAYPEGDPAQGGTHAAEVALPAGARNVRTLRIDEDHHNITRAWRELGAPATLTVAQAETLRARNHLEVETPACGCESAPGETRVRASLPSPGVLLIEADLP